MKRLSLLLLISVGVFVLFSTSCTKCDDESSPQEMKKALIKGSALANLDITNDTNQYGGYQVQWEKIPAGTKIIARINSEDLVPNPSWGVEYGDILFETSVDNQGKFEVEVYAGEGNVPVTFFADDFEYDVKINDSTYEMKVFSLQPVQTNVIANQTRYFDLIFVSN